VSTTDVSTISKEIIKEIMPLLKEQIAQEIQQSTAGHSLKGLTSASSVGEVDIAGPSESNIFSEVMDATEVQEDGSEGRTFSYLSSIPLGAILSESLKTKIWQGKYVDLEQLVNNRGSEDYTIQWNPQQNLLLKSPKTKKINNFDQWL
jgi:hypothetical protein